MTEVEAGMTEVEAGMTEVEAGMTGRYLHYILFLPNFGTLFAFYASV